MAKKGISELSKLVRHPIQPIVKDNKGVIRFKENKIITYLFDIGALDLNKISCITFSDEDRCQIAQLLGYSVSGYGDLSYVDRDELAAIDMMAKNETDPKDELIKHLKDKLKNLQESFREGIADLYNIHPADLGGEQ